MAWAKEALQRSPRPQRTMIDGPAETGAGRRAKKRLDEQRPAAFHVGRQDNLMGGYPLLQLEYLRASAPRCARSSDSSPTNRPIY